MTTEPLGWCVIEQIGHRRFAGHISEVELAGVGFLRLDIPETARNAARTMLIYPATVFGLHPCGEAEARAVADLSSPAPVQLWEIRELTAPANSDSVGVPAF